MADELKERTEASHLIEFGAPEGVSGYTLELDPDLNNGATTFPVTTSEEESSGDIHWAYLRGWPCTTSHDLGSNLGAIPIIIPPWSCIGVELEETLTFCGESTATVTHPIDSLVGTQYGNEWKYEDEETKEIVRGTYWDGTVHPWTYDGVTITLLDGALFGVLHIRYSSKCDKFKHYSIVAGTAQCHNTTEYGTDCCNVIYEMGDLKTVVLTVKDYCTDEAVPGAVIKLTGDFKSGSGWSHMTKTFPADAKGQITFDSYSGAVYDPMVITCTGYEDSKTDSLKNDAITIP